MVDSVRPDDAILLHIGPHKTGTTAIQGALAAARPQLLDAGILYPGRRLAHNRQASAALQHTLGWDHARADRGQWDRLAARVRAHSGRTIISSEVFCEADEQAAARIVGDLGTERVQVVLTLRPLEALLPSSWQQYIKSGYFASYDDWLSGVLESRDKPTSTRSFWVRHNHPALIRRWRDALGGPQHLVVVVTDSAHPRNLFDAFEHILALPHNTLDAGGAGPSNRSLSVPEVELLRALNHRARQRVPYRDYHHFVKSGAVLNLAEGRAPGPDEPRVVTPARAIAQARKFSRSDVKDIAAMGVTVLGDLDALAPDSPIPDVAPLGQPDGVSLEIASAFLFALMQAGVELRASAEQAADAARAALREASRPPAQTLGVKLDQALAGARSRLGAFRRRLPGR